MRYRSRKITSKAARFKEIVAKYRLSPAEKNVAAYAIEGLSNKEIAKKLRVTPVTIGVHLSSVYRKTGVGGRQELAWLMERGRKTTKKAARKRIAKKRPTRLCSCSKLLLASWKYCPICGKKAPRRSN